MKLNLGLESLSTTPAQNNKSIDAKLMESMSVLYTFLGDTYKKELDTILSGITTDSIQVINSTHPSILACETLNASVDVSCEGWFKDWIANISYNFKTPEKHIKMMKTALDKLKSADEIAGFEDKVIPVSVMPYADATKFIGLLEKARGTYNKFKFADLMKDVKPDDPASVQSFKAKCMDFIKSVKDARTELNREGNKYEQSAVRDKTVKALGYNKKTVTDVIQKSHDILNHVFTQWTGDLNSLNSLGWANSTAVSFKARVFGAGPEYVIAQSVQRCIAALNSYINTLFVNGYWLSRTSFKLARYCAGIKIEAGDKQQ